MLSNEYILQSDPSKLRMLLGDLILQTFDPRAGAVFIPLAFGLGVGLIYFIISCLRRAK